MDKVFRGYPRKRTSINVSPRVWLRDRRIEAGLLQREVAGRIGINSSYYSQIETGRMEPGRYTKKAIAKALGFDVGKWEEEEKC